MIKLGTSVKSGIGAILRACAPDTSLFLAAAFDADGLRKPEKAGHPPSRCYGSEPSCHSDSW
jgi:hypothetical protein